ncbi:type VII secretion integral membrane protein EccD [Actinacidiphila yanglinensis]|uniref:Type VII secretion integral membrane protein EccD n=1 Tax=Actinacidiphila yanglinensis TaxID=310779 RepID=A0A1H5Y423_9ACTN|nr:type VII secretion integral membrane protein EccD [Actinacidiphila yanglinensis]SEG18741.1 type VII secretion integral membrane protein EccD [Actinacidiphila yanglinensis]
MENERCHVTVVGARRRVDLAVPAEAAIAEYTPALLQLVGQVEFDETLPPVWSLALPGAVPFAPEASLRESGVADGATLYLRDVAADEFDEPVVTDLEETVARTDQGFRVWNRRSRAYTTLILGVLSLIAGFVVLARTGGRDSVLPATRACAVLVALSLAVLAWQATRQGWSLPLRLRLIMAYAAMPLLAVAGATLPRPSSVAPVLVALGAGALLGALIGLLAIRHATTLLAVAITALALALTACLTAAHATLPEASAVVGVTLLAVLGAAPGLSGHFAVLAGSSGSAADGHDDEAGVVSLVKRGQRLLIGTNLLVSAVAAACLVVLGSTHQAFAVALAGCLGVALVLRAGRLTMAPAVVPVVVAGTTGLAATLTRAPGAFGAPGWAGPAVLLGAAVLALAAGLGRAFRGAGTSARPSWIDPLSGFLMVACVPLAVGVFGVYGTLLNAGRTP